MTCKKCQYFKITDGNHMDGDTGSCRRYAPRTIQVTRVSMRGTEPEIWHGWPKVLSGDFCGEFKLSDLERLALFSGKSQEDAA